MSPTTCDVAIIGGGPAGTTAATVLARAGLHTVILERDRFPRFHVGESLLPYQKDLMARLGLSEVMAERSFMTKTGAWFCSNDGSVVESLDFNRYLQGEHRDSWEVERSEFDQMLLDHARAQGAQVLEEHAVGSVELAAEDNRLEVRPAGGTPFELRARWVLDASGQGTFLAKRLGLKQPLPDLAKVALFSHFAGGARMSGRHEGDIQLIFGDGCWFWYIPLKDDKVSVGCVTSKDRWKGAGQDPETFFAERLASSPLVQERLARARRTLPVHVAADYSYDARRYAGDGFALLGDAAAFLDPIFSTGVLLAMKSGEAAAQALADAQRRGERFHPRHLRRYQKQMRRWTRGYFRLIRTYYHPGFPAVFFRPRPKYRRALAPFFAGKVDLSLRQRWFLALFYGFVRLNHRLHLVPDPRPAAHAAYHG